MKKLVLLSMMCLMALSMVVLFSCTREEGEESGDYVDLGLSSGIKWKAVNEKNAADAEYDFYTYDEAVSQFGNSLPTKEQCEELKAECQWSWNGSGYKVTGPNGNSIVLPASGGRDCAGSVNYVGSYGYCWSSTPGDSSGAWFLGFYSGGVFVRYSNRCFGRSVRLVQDK